MQYSHDRKLSNYIFPSTCSAENRGGCCSRAIAEETDAIQMLMNMLAGVETLLLATIERSMKTP